jgi:hypothetical protein
MKRETIEEQEPEEQRQQAITKIRFGQPYENTRKHSKFDYGEDLVVIPVEIEIQSELYNLIQMDILDKIGVVDKMSFQEWVNICFRERMEQIVTDPKEWGKVLLNPIRRGHCLAEVDIEQ